MFCNMLHQTATLQHAASHCIALQHAATSCNTLQHTKLRCITLQHTATHCNTQLLIPTHLPRQLYDCQKHSTKAHAGLHCNILQYIATHCNTLQHTATHSNTLQHDAPHCNTLQHNVPHCNTLQQTATQSACSLTCCMAARNSCSKLVRLYTATHCNTHCNTARTATRTHHCNTLHSLPNLLQGHHKRLLQAGAVVHCNALQHTATHCNTLQHTATYYNTLQHLLHGNQKHLPQAHALVRVCARVCV